MLVFVVPVKSEKVSTNWKVFSILVERTMQSICQQTSQNFKVVVVCHEIPEMNFKHENLEFIQVDFDPPSTKRIDDPNEIDPKNPYRNVAKEEDKARKIMKGVEYGRKYNPDYYMVVDADDCISKHLVKFVDENKSPENVGWYFKQGFIYNEGSNLIFLNKNTFNVLCGTCIIVAADYVDQLLPQEPFVVFTHDFTTLSNGKEMKPLPFTGAIYSIANTENYCSTPEAVKRMNSYKIFEGEFYVNIIRKMKKYRIKLVNRNLRNTFGLYKLDFSKVFETTE
ncbi:hypothetical protein [Muriicola sp. Z0-33]|uniref:hypothetical protein n=1 Tax=Muriicola sp. Z0-33 TaxID=2816957 RepID=UPI0022373730|nr:hypothetical protein [Muriicola sp. Z0-33]MCW5515613.1 hypothetical protein [Muriicola sp. Z0-33]